MIPVQLWCQAIGCGQRARHGMGCGPAGLSHKPATSTQLHALGPGRMLPSSGDSPQEMALREKQYLKAVHGVRSP